MKRTDLSARIVARSSSSRADAPTAVDVVVSAIANAGFGSPPSGTDRLVRGALPALATQTLSPPRKRWRSVPPESSVLVAVKMRGYLANSPRELTVPVEANQR